MHYVLILACDLLPDGSDIGFVTQTRLQAGLEHCIIMDATPVVAASWSPRHPAQSQTMSRMMADWLERREVPTFWCSKHCALIPKET